MNSRREPADLANLDLAACRPGVGTVFRLTAHVDRHLDLTLVEARSTRRDPAVGDANERPFSLLFRGPAAPVLPQGMHDLESDDLLLAGIFLVPLGPDDDTHLYEAVFS